MMKLKISKKRMLYNLKTNRKKWKQKKSVLMTKTGEN